jgi:hypothetical protein
MCGTGAKWKREVVPDHKVRSFILRWFYPSSPVQPVRFHRHQGVSLKGHWNPATVSLLFPYWSLTARLTGGARYVWLYVLVVKSFMVYISDIYTATTMLTSSNWSNKIYSSCKEKNGCVAIPFGVAKWLFVGCIIFSFLLVSMIRYYIHVMLNSDHLARLRSPQSEKNYCEQGHFFRVHKYHGPELLQSSYALSSPKICL